MCVKVVVHQKGVGAKGITAVFGPPAYTIPPFFRPSGMDHRYILVIEIRDCSAGPSEDGSAK